MIWENGRPIRQGKIPRLIFYLFGGFASSASIFVLFAAWYKASLSLGSLVLPDPLIVIENALMILTNINSSEIPITIYRVGLGLVLALSLGISLGIIAGFSRTLSIFCRPLITILLGMPPIIWVVLALFWFSVGNISIIFTVLITVTPFTFASASRGILTVDKQLQEMMRCYRLSYFNQIRRLYIPHLLNYLIPALSVAIGVGVKITIMAELLGSDEGIGAKIATARAMLDTVEMMAYVVIVLAIIMLIEYLILEPLRIILMPWENNA